MIYTNYILIRLNIKNIFLRLAIPVFHKTVNYNSVLILKLKKKIKLKTII